MTLHAWRLPFALDPLMAEAKRKMRQRRLLLATVLAVVVIGGVAAGLAPSLGNGPPPGLAGLPTGGASSNQSLAVAKYPGLSFRYPAGWGRHDRCILQLYGPIQELTVLTTSRPAGACARESSGAATRWPPRIPLRRNGVLAYLELAPNNAKPRLTHLGVPAPGSYCASIGGQRFVVAAVMGGSEQLVLGACLRGPDVTANERGLEGLLASVRWLRH